MSKFPSFLRLSDIPPYGSTTFCFSTHLSTDTWVVSAFRPWCVVRGAAVNTVRGRLRLLPVTAGVSQDSPVFCPQERVETRMEVLRIDEDVHWLSREEL